MLELDLPFRVGAKGVAALGFALGLHGQHFAGVIEDGGGGVLLRARPFRIGQRTERRRFLPDADIARDQIGLLERDIEFRFFGEFQRQHFLRSAALRRNARQFAETGRCRARDERPDRLH